MQYDEFIAQNRSIKHDKSCQIIWVGILQIQKAQRTKRPTDSRHNYQESVAG